MKFLFLFFFAGALAVASGCGCKAAPKPPCAKKVVVPLPVAVPRPCNHVVVAPAPAPVWRGGLKYSASQSVSVERPVGHWYGGGVVRHTGTVHDSGWRSTGPARVLHASASSSHSVEQHAYYGHPIVVAPRPCLPVVKTCGCH